MEHANNSKFASQRNRSTVNIGDDYLAVKILLESGNRVPFDGNPKDYIAFRHGINRITAIHGTPYGLVYDVTQSRCVGKVAEAIKFC